MKIEHTQRNEDRLFAANVGVQVSSFAVMATLALSTSLETAGDAWLTFGSQAGVAGVGFAVLTYFNRQMDKSQRESA